MKPKRKTKAVRIEAGGSSYDFAIDIEEDTPIEQLREVMEYLGGSRVSVVDGVEVGPETRFNRKDVL